MLMAGRKEKSNFLMKTVKYLAKWSMRTAGCASLGFMIKAAM
jgi:hypothetical protein